MTKLFERIGENSFKLMENQSVDWKSLVLPGIEVGQHSALSNEIAKFCQQKNITYPDLTKVSVDEFLNFLNAFNAKQSEYNKTYVQDLHGRTPKWGSGFLLFDKNTNRIKIGPADWDTSD